MKYYVLLSLLILSACNGDGPAPPPHAMYRADFDPKNIACAENVIRTVSQKWDFRLSENDKRVMKRVNEGVDAFYIFVIAKDKDPNDGFSWVMTIGNLVKGSILSLSILDYKGLSVMQKDKLAQEVVSQLSAKCNTQLTLYIGPHAKKPQK